MKSDFLVLPCMTLVLAGGLRAASFDCAKAKSKTEKAICGDPDLSKLDEQLATTYKMALATHPLPTYVRARQIDWLKGLRDVDTLTRLKERFSARIDHLKNANEAAVYSDANEKFSYESGDSVAELWSRADGKLHLSVWGGFEPPSMSFMRTNGMSLEKPPYFGCEFEAVVQQLGLNSKNSAVTKEGDRLVFALSPEVFTIQDGNPGCGPPSGRLHSDELKRVFKR